MLEHLFIRKNTRSSQLTDRALVKEILNEKTNEEIALKYGFSFGYIKRRLHILFKLYKVKTRVGLVREVLLDQFKQQEVA